MSVSELITQALELPPRDRAELISVVFDSIDGYESSNDNDLYDLAMKRDAELEQGVVKALSHDEFMAAFSARHGD
jgi:hypothetical protein